MSGAARGHRSGACGGWSELAAAVCELQVSLGFRLVSENWLAEETTPAAVHTDMAQLAVEYIEFPYGLLLALNECSERIRFVVTKESALMVMVLTCFSGASVFSSVRLVAS